VLCRSFSQLPTTRTPTDAGTNNVYGRHPSKVLDGTLTGHPGAIAVNSQTMSTDNAPVITSNGGRHHGVRQTSPRTALRSPTITADRLPMPVLTLTYSIVGGPADARQVHSRRLDRRLVVRLGSRLRGTLPTPAPGNIYDVTPFRSPMGTLTDTSQLPSPSTNVNDQRTSDHLETAPPAPQRPSTSLENGTAVTDRHCDRLPMAGSTLTYSIVGVAPIAARFQQSTPRTGALSFVSAPDYENLAANRPATDDGNR